MTKRAVVSVSGGKDSTATALLAIEEHGVDDCRFVFADTGNEHELTCEYVNDYLPRALGISIKTVKADFSKQIIAKHEYIEHKWPGKSVPDDIVKLALSVMHPTDVPFIDLCLWKNRFPSRKAQFCTQELKRIPLDNYMLEFIGSGCQVESWRGIRRDESGNRKNALRTEMTAEGWLIQHPIVDWTAEQVVEFVTVKHNLELNPLYKLGMGRVGCMPCINCSKSELSEIAKRFPEHIDKIRKWERLMCHAVKRGFATFFCGSVEEGRKQDHEYVYNLFNIDSKVEWSMTTHGGKHFDLLKTGSPPECSSLYGLCE